MRVGTVVENAVCSVVAPAGPVEGLPQVGGPIDTDRLIGLLRVVSRAGEVTVKQSGSQALGHNGPTVLAPAQYCLRWGVIQRVDDPAGGDFGLVDRRHRLWVVIHA